MFPRDSFAGRETKFYAGVQVMFLHISTIESYINHYICQFTLVLSFLSMSGGLYLPRN